MKKTGLPPPDIWLNIICIALCLFMSCKKSSPNQANTVHIEIDSLAISGFVNMKVSATFQVAVHSANDQSGICWSKTLDPVVVKSAIFQPNGDNLRMDTLILGLDSNTAYHVRAFYISGKDTTYSVDKTLMTRGMSIFWSKSLSNGVYPQIKKVLSLADNGFIILTQIDPMYGGFPWPRLTRVDTMGNVVWSYDYDQGQDERPDLLLAESDGFVVLAHLMVPGTSAVLLFKTDLNGTLLWRKEFADSVWQTQFPAQLYEDNNSNIIVASRALGYQSPADTFALGPLLEDVVDQSGNLLTKEQLPNTQDLSYSLLLTTPANADGYLALYTINPLGPYSFGAKKFSNNNGLEWNNSYTGGRYGLSPVAVMEEASGNYVILAWDEGDGATPASSVLYGIDKSNGNILWKNVYGFGNNAPASTIPTSFANDNADDYYVTGDGQGGAFIEKTDDQGRFIWSFTFKNATGIGEGDAIFLFPNNEIYLFSVNSDMYLTKLREY